MRVSKRSKVDFEFFLSTTLDAIGGGVVAKQDKDGLQAFIGLTALECWFMKDTYGKVMPCAELDLFEKAQRGKASWNLQIKMWAEDLAGELLFVWELKEYCKDLPSWILEATHKQGCKLIKERLGWIPKFLSL